MSTNEATESPVPASGDVTPDHDVRGLLAITPFRRLWLALGLSSLGDWLGLLATTALAGALPQTPAAKLLAVSGVFILRLAPAVLLGPVAGVVADRLPRRWTLVYGDVARFLLFVSIPLVGTLWWLYVAIVLVEVVGLFWMPAKEATVPNLVPRRRLEAANQLSLVVTYGSAPVAAVLFSALTLLSGVLDDFIGHLAGHTTYLALYVNALTFLVSAIVIWRLELPPSSTTSTRQVSVWRAAIDGWAFIGRTPLVRGLVLGMLGAFAAGGFVIGLAQSYVGGLGAGSPGYGMLFGAVFVGMAAGMWLAPRLLAGFPRRRLFGLSIAAAGVWLVLLSLVPNLVLAMVFIIGLGACAGAAWVTGYTLLGLEVGDDVRGRTFAFVQSMVRVVLISVLALGPVLAAGFSKAFALPSTLRLNEFVSLTYTGAMATFLLAGLIAVGIGIAAYRQMDDRQGVRLGSDLLDAVRRRQLHDASARQNDYPGRFIAFEGGDGAGKSTQVRLLSEWLEGQGYERLVTYEPGGTPAGKRMRELLLHSGSLTPRAEALLFAADRAQHVETVVRPALGRGEVVVTDRFSDSSVAYQGGGRDLGTSRVAQLSRWSTEGLVPDLTVVLDIDPQAGRRRTGDDPDRLESEPDDFHLRVREGFLELARQASSRYLVIDALQAPEVIHEQVVARLVRVLPESPVARTEREAREAREAAAEAARVEREVREQAEREEAERLAREEAERLALERAAQEGRQRAERERAEREAREAAQEAHRAAQERVARERAAAEAAALRLEEARRAERQAVIEAETRAQPSVAQTAPLPVVEEGKGRRGRRPAMRRPEPDGDPDVPLDEEIFGWGERDQR